MNLSSESKEMKTTSTKTKSVKTKLWEAQPSKAMLAKTELVKSKRIENKSIKMDSVMIYDDPIEIDEISIKKEFQPRYNESVYEHINQEESKKTTVWRKTHFIIAINSSSILTYTSSLESMKPIWEDVIAGIKSWLNEIDGNTEVSIFCFDSEIYNGIFYTSSSASIFKIHSFSHFSIAKFLCGP